MATILAKRLASTTKPTISFLRYSFNVFYTFSSSSTSSSAAASSNAKKSGKRRKKKNLFEVAQFLPKCGIGYHMAKSHWTEVSYEITKIKFNKDLSHGKAWGIAYKNGLPAADPKRISGVHKRCWRYIPSLSKSSESKPISPQSTATTPVAEVA